jgi:hypothetical protein
LRGISDLKSTYNLGGGAAQRLQRSTFKAVSRWMVRAIVSVPGRLDYVDRGLGQRRENLVDLLLDRAKQFATTLAVPAVSGFKS